MSDTMRFRRRVLGIFLPGLFRGRSGSTSHAHGGGKRVIVSVAAMLALVTPLCLLMAVTWELTGVAGLGNGIARAYALALGPYVLWLALLSVILFLVGTRRAPVRAFTLLSRAACFWIPYVLVWPLSIAWPFVVLLLFPLLRAGPFAWLYAVLAGGSVSCVALGLTVVLIGLSEVRRISQA
ncbi:MAG: hypothetical protein AMK72_06565 [Planctomycetes bacterium SM23_25]|nr:MAG: hypothetical protein AMK72_06565 [Planctomycetes bacterium SM23_25]